MPSVGIFLDRDGVINRNVYYADSGEWESPRDSADVVLHEGAAAAIKMLNEAGLPVFIVSNQPSYAKGKTPLEALERVHSRIIALLAQEGAHITESFYAYDHPQAIIADVPGPKGARKPSPYFLQQAAAAYGLDLARCWMVGDRDTDIECGQQAGCRTVLVEPDHPGAKAGQSRPDYIINELNEFIHLWQSVKEK
jgi:D-glycero-D-manno-heptose 1,7-bisphosphate phosphatase